MVPGSLSRRRSHSSPFCQCVCSGALAAVRCWWVRVLVTDFRCSLMLRSSDVPMPCHSLNSRNPHIGKAVFAGPKRLPKLRCLPPFATWKPECRTNADGSKRTGEQCCVKGNCLSITRLPRRSQPGLRFRSRKRNRNRESAWLMSSPASLRYPPFWPTPLLWANYRQPQLVSIYQIVSVWQSASQSLPIIARSVKLFNSRLSQLPMPARRFLLLPAPLWANLLEECVKMCSSW